MQAKDTILKKDEETKYLHLSVSLPTSLFRHSILRKKTKIGQEKRTYYVFPKEMFYICKNLKKNSLNFNVIIMKKIFIFLLFLMATIHVCHASYQYSKEPVKTVSTNYSHFTPYYIRYVWGDIRKRWSGYCVLKNGEEFTVRTFERTDSVFAGQTYSLMEFQAKDTIQFLARQEGKRVYRYDEEAQAEVLMVDYSLEVGDEVEVDGGLRLKVTETGSAYEQIPMAGLKYSKMLKLRGVDDETLEDVWVEGVGSIYWGVMPRDIVPYVEKMYVVNTSFSLLVGNAAFPVCTDRYKANLLYYRDLPAEADQFEYELKNSDYLDIYFKEDTLCVTGILEIGPYDFQLECRVDSTNIDINIYTIDVEEPFESQCGRYMEAKFPGFKDGVYQVRGARWIGASPVFPNLIHNNYTYQKHFFNKKSIEVVCGADSLEFEGEKDINGLKYLLRPDNNTAMVANGNQRKGELTIPEYTLYHSQFYMVNSIEWQAFSSCEALTKVNLPKSIASIEHSGGWDACKNPFDGCTALESIEVDKENPWMCSVDGVLFNKEKTWLYSYPAGSKREVYDIPEGVERTGMNAFAYNSHLTSVYMPNSITHIDAGAFSNCKSLDSVRLSENLSHIPAYTFEQCENLHYLDIPENVSSFEEGVFRWSPIRTLIIRGTFPEELRSDTFYGMDEETTVIYVQRSEIEKFKKVFSGTVLPLEEYGASDIKSPDVNDADTSSFYDLTGRPVAAPAKGIYIQNGKKVMVK